MRKKRPGEMVCRMWRWHISEDANPLNRGWRQAFFLTALTFLMLASVLAWGPGASWAKEKKTPSKTLSGAVFDDAGNPLQGATVELADAQSGKVLDIYSQQGGSYQFADLSLDHDYK